MSDVKVLFSGRGQRKDIKTTQKKTVTRMHSKKTFFIIHFLYNRMNIHSIKGKRKSPIFAPVFTNKSSREYLSDLTIRVVKETT